MLEPGRVIDLTKEFGAAKPSIEKQKKSDSAVEKVEATVFLDCQDVIPEGRRNDALFRAACFLQAQGYEDSVIRNMVNTMATRCVPPLDQDEVEAIVSHVLRDYAKGLTKDGSTAFDHSLLGDLLLDACHICLIDGALAIWNGERYEMGEDAVSRMMLRVKRNITKTQRREVISYLRLEAPKVEMADPRYIAFTNGTLDIETGELVNHAPSMAIPNIIPHEWNPEAYSKELDGALDAWACGREEVRKNLEEVIGLCLYRGRELSQAPILLGEGSNGKSTYLNFLHRLVGDENVSSMDASTIGKRFQSTALMGRLANIGDDISNEFLAGGDLSVVKKVVTGDWVPAEVKGGETFAFRPYCTTVFAANEMPALGDKSKGMLRRFAPIPFDAAFSRDDGTRILNMERLLSTEEACEYGIVLGIAALKRVLAQGGLTEGSFHEEMVEDIRRQSSSVYCFAVDELGYGTDVVEDIYYKPTGDYYRRYDQYCYESGNKKVSRNNFSREMYKLFNAKRGKSRECGIFLPK